MAGAFKRLVKNIEAKGEPASEAKAVAAKVGIEKYGKVLMRKKAIEGRKRAGK